MITLNNNRLLISLAVVGGALFVLAKWRNTKTVAATNSVDTTAEHAGYGADDLKNDIIHEAPKAGIQILATELWNFLKKLITTGIGLARLGMISFLLPWFSQLTLSHLLLGLIVFFLCLNWLELRSARLNR